MVETITLGDLARWAAFVVALGGSIAAIIRGVKKAVEAIILPLSLDNAKNYLVPFLCKVERGEPVDEIELERFHEEYAFYINHGGNSYVKSRVDKLKQAGKL
jgi:hypothetical protein